MMPHVTGPLLPNHTPPLPAPGTGIGRDLAAKRSRFEEEIELKEGEHMAYTMKKYLPNMY